MKKGEILEGIAAEIRFPNKAVVVCDGGERKGESCIVKNALPGQRISFQVSKVRKGKAEGRLLEVLSRSDKEKREFCAHFGLCGGCLYQSLPYGEQLRIKEEQVKQLLAPVLKQQDADYVWEPIKGSPEAEGYRNKMEFSFGDEKKDGPLSLGMHRRGSFYDVVTVTDCRIVDADYRRILQETLAYFQECGASYYHRVRHTGYLRHLLVRKAKRTGQILVALVTTTQEERNLDDFRNRLLELPLAGEITGILHIQNDSPADVVKSDETVILYGRDWFQEKLLGLTFQISPFSFFQTNSLGAEVLYETVREYVGDLGATGGKTERLENSVRQSGAEAPEKAAVSGQLKADKVVYDLYSGTGTIAQLMAPVAGKVIGVEIVEEAVEAARENARLNGLTNCEFIAGDVLRVVDEIEEKPDMIILDPPRDGIHPKALPKIIGFGVERIVYVSCKPTSLARDLEVFLAGGYRVERVRAVDMFPGTGNVETVVMLSREKSKQRR